MTAAVVVGAIVVRDQAGGGDAEVDTPERRGEAAGDLAGEGEHPNLARRGDGGRLRAEGQPEVGLARVRGGPGFADEAPALELHENGPGDRRVYRFGRGPHDLVGAAPAVDQGGDPGLGLAADDPRLLLPEEEDAVPGNHHRPVERGECWRVDHSVRSSFMSVSLLAVAGAAPESRHGANRPGPGVPRGSRPTRAGRGRWRARSGGGAVFPPPRTDPSRDVPPGRWWFAAVRILLTCCNCWSRGGPRPLLRGARP